MKLNTLKKNKEFSYVYRKGKPTHVKCFTMLCAKSRYGGVRVGFCVNKKVGNAVVRNRARRRMKEAFCTVYPELKGNRCIVFVVRPCIAQAAFDGILRDMRKAIKNARIMEQN